MAGADQSSVSLLTSKPAAKEGCRQQDGEAEAHHVALGATPQAHLLKGLLCFSTALFVLFLFSQPMLSWLFNDVLGYAADLCETPADEIQCGNQANYVEIAEKLGRRNAAGELIGCSCEDGILRDWSCAAGATSFSISYFISTAPGTGMMAALSAWPMIGAWFYGAGTLRKMSHADGGVTAEMDILGATLIAFQLFYGLFLVNTTCVAPKFTWSRSCSSIVLQSCTTSPWLTTLAGRHRQGSTSTSPWRSPLWQSSLGRSGLRAHRGSGSTPSGWASASASLPA